MPCVAQIRHPRQREYWAVKIERGELSREINPSVPSQRQTPFAKKMKIPTQGPTLPDCCNQNVHITRVPVLTGQDPGAQRFRSHTPNAIPRPIRAPEAARNDQQPPAPQTLPSSSIPSPDCYPTPTSGPRYHELAEWLA